MRYFYSFCRAAVAQLDRVLGFEPRSRGFESLRPHQILLFGSFASKTSTTESDLDIAVVLPDAVDKKSFRTEFYKNRTRIHIPVDFIFRNQTEFENLKNENPVDFEINQKGIELYPEWKFHV